MSDPITDNLDSWPLDEPERLTVMEQAIIEAAKKTVNLKAGDWNKQLAFIEMEKAVRLLEAYEKAHRR